MPSTPARRLLTLPLAALALLLAAVPSGAVITHTPQGHRVSYTPSLHSPVLPALRRTQLAAPPASGTNAAAATSPAGPCSSTAAACLSYGGGAILPSITLTAVYWAPAGLAYPSGYQTEINTFLADLVHDSSTGGSAQSTDFLSVLTQYYEGSSTHTYVGNTATVATPILDTDPYPTGAAACTSPFSSTRPCITDQGVQSELTHLITAGGLPTGDGHEYVLFFPSGVDTCFDGGGANDPNCDGTGYCGYHSFLSVGANRVEYANEPDNGDSAFNHGCDSQAQTDAAYATENTTSHEVSETITDPDASSGWYDAHTFTDSAGQQEQYGEIGDMCAWSFGQGDAADAAYIQGGSGGFDVPSTGSNETIDGHHYLLQDEWDNAHSTCSVSAAAASPNPPTAAFTDSASAPVLTAAGVSFDGTGSQAASGHAISSWQWSFGDGQSASGATVSHAFSTAGTFTVTLTVTDDGGSQSQVTHTVTVQDRPPTAAFSGPSSATAGSPATFDASASSDPDGSVRTWHWSWGDGTASDSSSAVATHAFPAAGTYTVTLTVTDNSATTSTALSHTVSVLAAAVAPPAAASSPVPPSALAPAVPTAVALAPTPAAPTAVGAPYRPVHSAAVRKRHRTKKHRARRRRRRSARRR